MIRRVVQAAAAACVFVAQPAWADCRTEYQQALNECTQGHNAYRGGRWLGDADWSFIKKCEAQVRPKFAACLDGEKREPGACDFAEAKTNIDWVMRVDGPALGTFRHYRNAGYSAVDAVVEAQGHNANAQKSIRRCVNEAARYLELTYGDKIAGKPAEKLPPSLDCLKVGPAKAEFIGSNNVLWAARLAITSQCEMRVRGKFCVRFGASDVFNGFQTIEKGGAVTVVVHDPRPESERLRDPRVEYVGHETCAGGRCKGNCGA